MVDCVCNNVCFRHDFEGFGFLGIGVRGWRSLKAWNADLRGFNGFSRIRSCFCCASRPLCLCASV
ncbi:MAG: hypothetical protein FWG87_09980 [Defluviitaleaceae bacterium]|nr:hypothetical protein [Defluviitaleaceae bacterium]